MKKTFFFLFLLFCPAVSSAQVTERILLPGKITAPEESELEGTTIYNRNSGVGTISDENGNFSIPVLKGDTLLISALQFKPFILIIDQNHLEKGVLEIPITLGLNQLPEVVVTPHDLSGNLNADIKKITIVEPNLPNLSFQEVKNIDFETDSQTKVQNSAISKPTSGGINFIAIIGGIISAIIPEKKEKPEVKIPRKTIHVKLRDLFEDRFFKNYLNIEEEEIMPFLYFVEDNWKKDELLRENKKLDLIQFLIEKSKAYKKLKE